MGFRDWKGEVRRCYGEYGFDRVSDADLLRLFLSEAGPGQAARILHRKYMRIARG